MQTPGAQEEDDDHVGELRHGDPTIDEKQGKELQSPRQKIYAPLVSKGPTFVTNSKTEKSNHQDIALGMNLFTSRRTKTNVIRTPSTVPEE